MFNEYWNSFQCHSKNKYWTYERNSFIGLEYIYIFILDLKNCFLNFWSQKLTLDKWNMGLIFILKRRITVNLTILFSWILGRGRLDWRWGDQRTQISKNEPSCWWHLNSRRRGRSHERNLRKTFPIPNWFHWVRFN